MHRTHLPKICSILLLLAAMTALGQTKSTAEVDPAKCWSTATGEVIAESLSVGNPHVFLALSGARVDAVSLDGKKVWSTEFGGEIRSNILSAGSGVLLVTSTTSNDAAKPGEFSLRSLSAETGIPSRTIKLPPAERYYLDFSEAGLIVASSTGTIRSLETKDHSVKWTREIANGFAAVPLVVAGKIMVASTSGQLFTVSAASGEIESMRKLPFTSTVVGQTASSWLIVGDERGNVTLFSNGSDKPYWRFKSGGAISHILEAAGGIIAVSLDNFVYFLNERNGDVVWKKRMGGRVGGIAAQGDRYIVVAGLEEHSGVLLDASTGKVSGQIQFDDDEMIVEIRSTPTGPLVLTNAALHQYGLTGCGQK